jgi:hypothetical protein
LVIKNWSLAIENRFPNRSIANYKSSMAFKATVQNAARQGEAAMNRHSA